MPTTLFPLASRGVPPDVDNGHVSAALHEQQEGHATAARYFLEVPISGADVERWGASLSHAMKSVLGKEDNEEASGQLDSSTFTWLGSSSSEAASDVPFYLPSEVFSMSSVEERRAAVHPVAPLPPFGTSRSGNATSMRSMSKVLQHRRKWLPYRQRIPLHQRRMEFLDVLSKHAVVTLVGSAGSGRTLQLPQILSETEALKRSRILLVAPNEAAARMTTLRLREERGEPHERSGKPGDNAASTVGCVLSLYTDACPHHNILVITADVLLRQLLCDPTLLDVSAVIIDDIHWRSERTELCLALLKELLVAQEEANIRTEKPRVPSLGSSLHVIVNCPDGDSAKQIQEFFSSSVPLTSFDLGSAEVSAGVSGSAVDPVLFYVDETVQWISKCTAEKKSTICTSPEDDLQPYVSKVEVVTQILTASEADFFDENKCRQYWCGLMLDALTHFDCADREECSQFVNAPLSVVVVVIPELEKSIKIVQDELKKYCTRMQNEFSKGDGNNGTSTVDFALHNLFEKDEIVLANELFYELLPSLKTTRTSGSTPIKTRHILLGPESLLESLLPPSINVGLVIDFARSSTCMFDIETAADTWVTEYASAAQLKYRRRIAKCVPSPSFGPNSMEHTHPLVIQLIPKSLLHSAARRRLNADAGHHPVFRLSSSQYLQLFQILQLRDDIVTAAEERNTKANAVFNVDPSTNASGGISTISSKISTVLPQYFIGVPASTSNKYEQSRRVFQQMEIFLRASGHLRTPKKLPPIATVSAAAVLQPLGILTSLWLLPMAVSRALIFGALLQRPLESTAAAAIWLAGDPFLAYLKSKENSGTENEEDLETDAAVSYEARKFFARNHSDIASLFYLYKMWLDQRQGGEEQEAAFLEECKVDRVTLERTLQYHTQLLDFMRRGGIVEEGVPAGPHTSQTEMENAVAKSVVALRDHAFMDEMVQAAISSAVYPHCAVPQATGAVKLYEGMYAGGSARVHRVGVFAKSSVMQDVEALHSVQNAPVVYLTRLTANNQHHRHQGMASLHSVSLPVLEQNMLLHQAASVIFCGEEKEVPREAPRRCRGWSSVVSSAWRKTRRARILPPSAEVPPVAIPLQPFDVIESKQVVVVVDGQLQYLMRSTTAHWLRQLRQYIQCNLRTLVSLPKAPFEQQPVSSAKLFTGMSKEVSEAWQWWDRRREGAVDWLREERWKYTNALLKAKQEDDAAGRTAIKNTRRLYPFFMFQTFPGAPVPVQLPEKERTAVSASAALVEQGENEEGIIPTGEDGMPEVYTGKLPSADVDRIIRTCVESIAEAESRKVESKLLKDNPENFSFLDPSNELHEYYLYLLKQAAPNIEVLGDDIDGLIVFLKELEAELREELNLPPLEEEGQGSADPNAADGTDLNTISVEEVTGNEEDVMNHYQYGVQEEEAVSLIKKAAVRAIPPNPSTQQNQNRHQQGGGVLGAGNAGASPQHHGKTNSGTPFSTGAAAAPPPGSQDPTEAPGGPDEESYPAHPSHVSPNELLSLVEQGGLGPDNQLSSADARPSAAELAALLGEDVVDGGVQNSQEGEPQPPPVDNPLSRPPPPLPADLLEQNPPSVVVYPIPIPYPQHLGQELAKALGDTLGMKVGPTTLVGKVARIMLPNRKVERRCLEIVNFTCFGKCVYIFKNDRIVDNPHLAVPEHNPMFPMPLPMPPFPNGMGGMMMMDGLPPPPPGMMIPPMGLMGLPRPHHHHHHPMGMLPGGMVPPYGMRPPPPVPFFGKGMPPYSPPPNGNSNNNNNNNFPRPYNTESGADADDNAYRNVPQEWNKPENYGSREEEEDMLNTGETPKNIGVLSDSDDDNSSSSSNKSGGIN